MMAAITQRQRMAAILFPAEGEKSRKGDDEDRSLTMSGAGGKVLGRLHEGGLAPEFDEPRPSPQGPGMG